MALASLHGLDELAQARAVDGHRLLDEGVDALLDGVGQVDRPEVRRRGQEDDVDLVDDVLVGVEAGVLAVLGHVDPGADARALEARRGCPRAGPGRRRPWRRAWRAAVGRERLLGRAGAAAAAADQADLDRAAAGRVDHGNNQAAGGERQPPPPTVEPLRNRAGRRW